ncbi:cyclopropane-fatty-acyl-phospholipid synthase [Aspergillus saccharolyticus JOP 1030-1]|uniref:Cyclopropane-fatty-acyl-phospholipid synthase n=1 Tax=Aspergillus saccharolyticus JOP 1030-1 TaxID=1450539 RepID=A0A318ZI26_9EURO|nr:cyclopropane-fatty-acyl-phospholipid synthase [Aspergillus saccharolyticus JOP 1030-1]PYH47149.1 cyclopropane-fatty-acyl-phospholipid synthase [Aspergillus saccharolyticus JOP 1030-1]
MLEGLIQSYSRVFVLQALASIEHQERLTVVIKSHAQKPEIVAFGPESTVKGVQIMIVNPNAWNHSSFSSNNLTSRQGFAEAYIYQELECDDLRHVFQLYLRNRTKLGFGNRFLSLFPRLRHLLFTPTNTLAHSRSNVTFHYDTSNALFSALLSADMNYSNGWWSNDPHESLETAQIRSVHNILQKARISPTDHILDIGCGWGSLAIEAARLIGCRVTGITLASEQKALAEKRIKAAGLDDKITIMLCDYRDAPMPAGGYDRIVSVEMVEHVGKKYMNGFFGTISRLLKPEGGILVMQAITTNNMMHDHKPGITTFTDRYIFPGGYLCSTNVFLNALHIGSNGTLELDSLQSIGPSYIKTLTTWRENFLKNWELIRQDYIGRHPEAKEDEIEAFRRVWVYYFTYCEAGFRSRVLTNHVITAVRTPEPAINDPVPVFDEVLEPKLKSDNYFKYEVFE